MFNFNYLFSSFPSHSSLNFNREVALSHASFVNCGQDDQGDVDDKNKKSKNKKKKNKGRHTKIRTASGVRDRRVRLSMEVSRKFFDLQDALGLDTASDTLEWLISESGNAIEEVKLATDQVPGRCPYNYPGENAADRGCDQAEKEARRECRARARARARERTQAKRKHHSDDWSDLLP